MFSITATQIRNNKASNSTHHFRRINSYIVPLVSSPAKISVPFTFIQLQMKKKVTLTLQDKIARETEVRRKKIPTKNYSHHHTTVAVLELIKIQEPERNSTVKLE